MTNAISVLALLLHPIKGRRSTLTARSRPWQSKALRGGMPWGDQRIVPYRCPLRRDAATKCGASVPGALPRRTQSRGSGQSDRRSRKRNRTCDRRDPMPRAVGRLAAVLLPRGCVMVIPVLLDSRQRRDTLCSPPPAARKTELSPAIRVI